MAPYGGQPSLSAPADAARVMRPSQGRGDSGNCR
jgi:hypothetical protein